MYYGKSITTRRYSNAFAMIEAIVGLAVAAILMLAFWNSLLYSQKVSRANTARLKAQLYLRESVEVAIDLSRSSSGWSQITNCESFPNCHPAVVGSNWSLASGPETVEPGYSRSITASSVMRNPLTGEIVSNGGTDDPNTKKATASITWDDGFGLRTATLETYLYKP